MCSGARRTVVSGSGGWASHASPLSTLGEVSMVMTHDDGLKSGKKAGSGPFR